jgi:hypothetical protein
MSDSESNSTIDYFSVSEAEVSYGCFRKVFGVMTATSMHPVHAIAIHASVISGMCGLSQGVQNCGFQVQVAHPRRSNHSRSNYCSVRLAARKSN